MQPLLKFILSYRSFQGTSQITKQIRIKQMQPVSIYLFSNGQFQDLLEIIQSGFCTGKFPHIIPHISPADIIRGQKARIQIGPTSTLSMGTELSIQQFESTLSKTGDEKRKVITLSKVSMTLSKEVRNCPNQGHRINALSKRASLFLPPSPSRKCLQKGPLPEDNATQLIVSQF